MVSIVSESVAEVGVGEKDGKSGAGSEAGAGSCVLGFGERDEGAEVREAFHHIAVIRCLVHNQRTSFLVMSPTQSTQMRVVVKEVATDKPVKKVVDCKHILSGCEDVAVKIQCVVAGGWDGDTVRDHMSTRWVAALLSCKATLKKGQEKQ